MRAVSSTRVQVAWIYVFAFATLFIFAALWWPISQTVSDLYALLQASWPTEMSHPAYTFVNNVFHYGPPIFLFALLIWVYVNSQKRRSEYY